MCISFHLFFNLAGDPHFIRYMSEAPSSLNYVLELLVAAQREILDTQRELCRDMEARHLGENSQLVQKYQENSLGLLNAAAEGLVRLIMHWRPTLEAHCFGLQPPPPLVALPPSSKNSVRQRSSEISSNMLVATLAEVETLEGQLTSQATHRRVVEYLFRWVVKYCHRLKATLHKTEAEQKASIKSVVDLSDAIRSRSRALVQRHRSSQMFAVSLLESSTVRALALRSFTKWHYAAARHKFTKRVELSKQQCMQEAAATSRMFETFSVWHRGKLCRQIEALTSSLQEAQCQHETRQRELEAELQHQREGFEEQLNASASTLAVSTGQLTTLQADFDLAQLTINELTKQLEQQNLMFHEKLALHQRQTTAQLSAAFGSRIHELEDQLAQTLRQQEHEKAAWSAFVHRFVFTEVRDHMNTTFHLKEVHEMMKLSLVFDSLQKLRTSSNSANVSPAADDSDVDAFSSNGDSIDRVELVYKLSQLTQEVEQLRSERTASTLISPSHRLQDTGKAPFVGFASPVSQSRFDWIPAAGSAAQTVNHSALSVSDSGAPATGRQEEILQSEFRAARAMAATLLRSRCKAQLAASCFRKWCLHASGTQQRHKVTALEQEKRSLMQTCVEERDRALMAMDEQVEDEHYRIQAVMNESRHSTSRIGSVDAVPHSPSPFRSTMLSLEGSVLQNQLAEMASLSPMVQHNRRGWSVGYRSPLPNAHATGHHSTRVNERKDIAEGNEEPFIAHNTKVLVDQETMTEADDASQAQLVQRLEMVGEENEELHHALTASHLREQSVLAELETALSQHEALRVNFAELQDAAELRLATAQEETSWAFFTHSELTSRADIAYNELRARLRMTQIQCSWAEVQASDNAVVSEQASARLKHTTLAATVNLQRSCERSLLSRYFVSWNELLVVRRSQQLLVETEERVADQTRKALEKKFSDRLTNNESELRAHFRKEVILATQANESLSRKNQLLQLEMQDLQSDLLMSKEILDVEKRQSKSLIRQLHNDIAVNTLLLGRCGEKLVEYCASSCFHKWQLFSRKRGERQRNETTYHQNARLQASTKRWLAGSLDVAEHAFSAFSAASLSEYFTACKHCITTLVLVAQQQAKEVDTLSGLSRSVELRNAALQLEITDDLKPRLAEAEREKDLLHQQLLEEAAKHHADTERIRDEHKNYCTELTESEQMHRREQHAKFEEIISALTYRCELQLGITATAACKLTDSIVDVADVYVAAVSSVTRSQGQELLFELICNRDSTSVEHAGWLVDVLVEHQRALVKHENAVTKARIDASALTQLVDCAVESSRALELEYTQGIVCACIYERSNFQQVIDQSSAKLEELEKYCSFLEDQITALKVTTSINEARASQTLASHVALVAAIEFEHRASLQDAYEVQQSLMHQLNLEWTAKYQALEAKLKLSTSQWRADETLLLTKHDEELERTRKENVKQLDELQREQRRRETLWTEQLNYVRENSKNQIANVELNHRAAIAALESSHRQEFELLQSHCRTRLREELAVELENRLEALTLSKQEASVEARRVFEERLDELRLEHANQLKTACAAVERLSSERLSAEIDYVLRQSTAKVTAEQSRALQNICELEEGCRTIMLQLERHTFVQLKYFSRLISEHTEQVRETHEQVALKTSLALRVAEDKWNVERATLENHYKSESAALIEIHKRELRNATDKVMEVKIGSSAARRSLLKKSTNVVLLLLDALRRAYFFDVWRRWNLLRAFRSDYQLMKRNFEVQYDENVKLRIVVARALEEQRRNHRSPSLGKEFALSPLSDSSPPLRTSSDVANSVLLFSSRVNDSYARRDAAVKSSDALVAEFDELLRRSKHSTEATEVKTESF